MNKKTGKLTKKQSSRFGFAALVIVLAAVWGMASLLLTAPVDETETPTATSGTAAETFTETATSHVQLEELEEVSIVLDHGLRITDVGKYTGVYMEDGSDEIVSGVMMIAVNNEGENDIQYAEITMPVGDRTASFSLSTLPVGSTVILLEKNRMEYVSGNYTEASAANVALFSAPLSLCEDQLEFQILDGVINVTNISGADITGDIVIYYKNSAADVYYGGITYRVRLEGGLQAGEIRQIMASHFSESGSTIMFVTCGES